MISFCHPTEQYSMLLRQIKMECSAVNPDLFLLLVMLVGDKQLR